MFRPMTRLCVVVALALAAVPPLRAEIIEQILVKVNGEIITRSEFEKRQLAQLATRPELVKLGPNSPQLAQAVAESTPELILDAIDELLWLQRAHEHGWAMSAEQLGRMVGDIRKENNLVDDATFKKALESEGMTENDLRKSLERRVLIRQVQQVDVTEKINVTDEEIRAFYDAHAREFTSPSEVMLREILIAVPVSERGINVAQSDAAREQAEEIRKRLVAGESFPKLATELSAAASKNNDGGLVGPVKVDELNPALQDLVNGLKIGQISEVLSTTRGFQIFKLESRSETKVKTLEEARGDVSRRVAEGKYRGEMLKYLERLREQAKIDFKNDELKKAYEKALADRRAAVALETLPKS
jgi:parvulin-like peptidyl-prolyl isomerase